MAPPPPSAQEKAALFEVYQRQLEGLARQVEFIQGVIDEVVRARRGLEGLATEASKEVLVPMGASTFIRGTVRDEDIVITGIGAGYATEKPRAEALRRLEEREGRLQQDLERLMQTAVQLQQEAAALEADLAGSSPEAA